MRLTSILLTLLVSLIAADQDIGLCCLCDKCNSPLQSRLTLAVDSRGYTCNALALDMADTANHIRVGNAACRQLKAQHYDRCCNPRHNPTPIAQGPTVSPGASFPRGPFSPCNLCANGQRPANPGTVVAVLNYPDVKSCIGLYWAGLNGYFEDRICRPLRNFYEVPCGCNVAPGNNGGAAPVQVISVGGSTPQTGTGNNNSGTAGVPTKKVVPGVDTKSQTKMSNSDNNRGGINRFRSRVLKGDSA